jgi:hypothetical protein
MSDYVICEMGSASAQYGLPNNLPMILWLHAIYITYYNIYK